MRPITFLICFFAFAYVAIRCFTVGITYDEVWTYYGFAKSSIWDTITAKNPQANNHILNTLLVKFCSIFSTTEFFLRLPNLISYGLYLYAINKISKLYTNNCFIGLCLIIVLLTNYTLLHFFGLSRGYGIAIACMMMSIYQLILYVQNKKRMHLHGTFSFALLSVYANFTLLNVYVATFIIVLFTIALTYKKETDSRKHLIIVFCHLIVALVLLTYPILRIRSAGELYYGGTNSIYTDTYISIMKDYFGHTKFYRWSTIINNTYLTLIISSIILSVYALVSKKTLYKGTYLAPIILFICVLITIIQFNLLNTKLVISRTALYLFPLLVLSVFTLIIHIHKHSKAIATTIAIVLASIGTYNFANEANFFTTREWWDECYNKQVLAFINEHNPNRKNNIKLCTVFPLENSFKYYIDKKYKTAFDNVYCWDYNSVVELKKFDYLYFPKHMYIVPDTLGYKIIKTYQEGNYILYSKDN